MESIDRNHSIDILKFICSVLVVFIHVPDNPFYDYYLPLTRCAVPCFFMISGYMMYRKKGFEESIKRSIRKIFIIIIWSTLLFGIVKFIHAYYYNDFSFISLKNFIFFILLNENPFEGHLWYLNAYLYTLVIVMFCYKYKYFKILCYSIPFLLLVNLLLGKYSFLINNINYLLVVRNFLFTGVPFFMLGVLLKYSKIKILNIYLIQKLSLLGIVLFSITSLIEAFILKPKNLAGDLYISTIFLSISLFVFVISCKKKHSNILSEIGKKDSLYIYIFHPLFIMVWSIFIFKAPESIKIIFTYIAPIVILITTLTSIMVFRLFIYKVCRLW